MTSTKSKRVPSWKVKEMGMDSGPFLANISSFSLWFSLNFN